VAAQQAPWVVAPLTPKEGEELFELWGTMTPSQSPLDRLPKALRGHWEAHRPHFAATLRHQEVMPDEAGALGVSLDAVMAPMKDGQRQAQRQQARAKGQAPRGPAGSQEVGCATGSSYDRYGERLCTRRMARMPEGNTATLKSQVTAEVMGALVRRPALRGIQVAEGAPDNGSDLAETLPGGAEGLAFSHATTPLGEALGAAYGERPPQDQERLQTWSEVLRDAPEGLDTVMGALCRLRTRYPRRQAMHKALASCREHRHRMD
jgi:hypothetical protein